jgi:hypothetical protein
VHLGLALRSHFLAKGATPQSTSHVDRTPNHRREFQTSQARELQICITLATKQSCSNKVFAMPPMQPQGSHLGLILPLCSSSATVGLAVFQYPVFLSFLQSKPSTAGRPLSRYWEPFLKQGGGIIVGLGLTSAVSGLVSWRWLQTHGQLETTAVSKWYSYGALFALAHFAFVPLVAGPIKNMTDAGESSKTEDEVDESNRKEMANWLIWHTVRTVVADIPALWCFAEGVALSFWVI